MQTMVERPINGRALAAPLFLFLGIAGCGDATNSSEHAVLRADKARTAFYNRPVTLAAARASSTPSPVIVMLSSDPWLMVIGSDSPTFALYDDGTAIFRAKMGFASAKLNQAQMDDLTRALGNEELAALSGRYKAADASDQPESNLLIYGNKIPFYTSVYGSLEDATIRSKVPGPVLAAFDRIRKFSVANARPWMPVKIEVMIWPYEYAPDRSIIWPKNWPNTRDPETRKRGDSFSIFMPSNDLPALKRFLAGRKERGAVEIDGKKWAVGIRVPFPHEALWLAPATS